MSDLDLIMPASYVARLGDGKSGLGTADSHPTRNLTTLVGVGA